MFKIDKKYVSFSGHDVPESVYTSINGSIQKEMLEKKAEELDRRRAETELERDRMLGDARAEAERILAEAAEKAAGEIKNASTEAENCREAARREGYDEGLCKARLEMEAERRSQADAVEDILKKIGGERDAVIDGLEGEIINLVMQISKKVINVQLEKDDTIFVELIKKALVRLKREGKIVIRVGRDEYERVFGGNLAEFVINDETVRAEVIEDQHFDRGDCVLESDGESINVGINSQLKYIELAFRRAAKDGV